MTGRGGAYFVEGNHDLFDDREVFESTVRGAGLRLLNNERAMTEVGGEAVEVMGLQWGPAVRERGRRYGGGDEALGSSMAAVAQGKDPRAFSVLLAHHPHAIDFAGEYGVPLTFCGHTHGGQLMLTDKIGPGPWMFRYWSGLYRNARGGAGVVSNGVGNWFPLRINAPAEILKVRVVGRGGQQAAGSGQRAAGSRQRAVMSD